MHPTYPSCSNLWLRGKVCLTGITCLFKLMYLCNIYLRANKDKRQMVYYLLSFQYTLKSAQNIYAHLLLYFEWKLQPPCRKYFIHVLSSQQMSQRQEKHLRTSVHPAKIQISLRIRAVWSESSLGALWITKDAKCLHADNEYWPGCADA